jgi:hypothetical protein
MNRDGSGSIIGLLFAAFFGLVSLDRARATDYEELHLDLDGSGTIQTVTLSTEGTEAIQSFSVRVGPWEYKGTFFGFEGEMPEMTALRIDGARSARQLLIKAVQPNSCIFHVLGFADGKLISLLTHDAGLGCRPPQPNGNGTVSLFSWQGFWTKEERYTLDAAATALTLVPQETYAVGVAGVAARPLSLEPGGCADATVAAGVFTRVIKFNPATSRFLVQARGGACGWVPRDDISASLDELPWKVAP